MTSGSLRKIQISLFLSGFSALVYQIVWLRSINVVFGVHVFSTSTVFTAFMAGLAIGSYFFGKISDVVKNPLKIYFFIEIFIGIYAIVFPFLFDQISEFYKLLSQNLNPGFYPLQLIKFILSFFVLIIPTTLMGGTLPVVIKTFTASFDKFGRKISLFYAVNNVGAALGGILAGFFLIRTLGLNQTSYFAAGMNFISAAVVFSLLNNQLLKKNTSERVREYPENLKKPYSRNFVRLILIVFAIEGFTTLAYEVLWTRILIEFSYDKTVYLYSTIIVCFILGLSLGSYVIKNRIDKIIDLPKFLAYTEIIIGIGSFALLLLFVFVAPLIVQNREIYNSWFTLAGWEYTFIFILLLPPVLLMGFTFPLVGKIYSDNLKKVGQRIGVIGFYDTVGSIFGAFVTGFVLIPILGVYYSFLSIVLLNIGIGFLLIHYHPGLKKSFKTRAWIIITFLVLIIFMPLHKEFYKKRIDFYPQDELIAYNEGVAATVSVHQQPAGHKALAINGAKTAFTTGADIKVHTFLACMPYIFCPDVRNACVVGFGMGVTVNCLSKLKAPHVDVAEISPEVVRTSHKHFAFLNDKVLARENVQLHVEDGRSFLFTQDDKYDLITTNAVHARLGANLYTRDFYDLCKRKLTREGFLCQWLPTNWLTKQEFKGLVKAFYEVFPNTSLWYVTRGHMLLLGSNNENEIKWQHFTNRFFQPEFYEIMNGVGIVSPEEFVAHLFASRDKMKKYTTHTVPNSDNYPYVEFSFETDIKPNISVLEELSNMQPTFNEFFTFDNDSLSQKAISKIEKNNQFYRVNLKNFVDRYK
jgi:spermidine synthase